MTASTRPPSAPERDLLGGEADVAVPSSRDELAGLIRAAEADGHAVVPAGEGAHAGWADPPPPGAVAVSAAAFDSVVLYEPDDFTIGVGAGMRLADLRKLLGGNGQEIPFEWPDRAGGTVGGLVARAATGARQGRYGPLGAFVLGVEGMRGEGRPFRSGGMVVKNVAGYQLAKLVIGALGRAGFLLRVNFKVRPLPARRRLGFALFEQEDEAWGWAKELRSARLEPAALLVLGGEARAAGAAAGVPMDEGDAAVAWVFEGNAEAVDWQRQECARLPGVTPDGIREGDDEAVARFLDAVAALGETDGESPADAGIVRLAVLPSALPGAAGAVRTAFADLPGFAAGTVADAATGLLTVRWSGPAASVDDPVPALSEIARVRDGSGRLLHLPGAARRRHRHALGEAPNAALADAVLAAFDPRGTFAREKRP